MAYRDSLPNRLFIGETHEQYLQLLSDSISNKALVQKAYESYFSIIDGFKKFLIQEGSLTIHNKLECYKKHEQYKLDFESFDLDNIKNEEHAFAVLLGLEPDYFSKFLSLDTKKCEDHKDEKEFGAYFYFKAEDKWFFNEYGKCIT